VKIDATVGKTTDLAQKVLGSAVEERALKARVNALSKTTGL